MTLLNKLVAAVTPTESESARRQARAKARAAATPGDWLSMVLDHHVAIESAFAATKSALTAAAQAAAQKHLERVLRAHANAEESVLYPTLANRDHESQAKTAYAEQATAKTQMALLKKLTPLSPQYMEKLEHIRAAVAHHIYEEEANWFPELKNQVSDEDQSELTADYSAEYELYIGHSPKSSRSPRYGSGGHGTR
jgi:hypothetical protein